ncbi:hypothetical protein Xaut_0235 [Xanthobacter versatilis]|uniref:Uncharacterized protein n=1 Tax=Xanthobacter autotrophicus (strain ATCC BAA-1158 / Py2) TaxID=78245 RepID=A7IBV0_XANP2|nr:hypothetical protein Xaut_0235 [Xanthobacter autotrophicus Py2]
MQLHTIVALNDPANEAAAERTNRPIIGDENAAPAVRHDVCALAWKLVAGIPPPVGSKPDHDFLPFGSLDANCPGADCTLPEVLSAPPRGLHSHTTLIDVIAHSIKRTAQLTILRKRAELGGHTLERVFGTLHTVCRRRRRIGLSFSHAEKWTGCVIADRRMALTKTASVCRAIEVVGVDITLIGERVEKACIVCGVFHGSVTAIATRCEL